jgi:flavin reductase (DIM6/NTAB) family NADH-FMN oxidoreductase RutF
MATSHKSLALTRTGRWASSRSRSISHDGWGQLPTRVVGRIGRDFVAGRPAIISTVTSSGVSGTGADTQAFEAIMTEVDLPFYVVTTTSGGELAGCLVGFATRCSIEPPRFGVWLSKLNHTYRVAEAATTLVVHLLRDGDDDLAERFGGDTGDEVDKFADLDWRPGPDGCPVVQRLDWFAGSIVDRVDTGDHVAFVLAPRGGRCVRSAGQLPGAEVGGIAPGHPIPGR